MEHWQLNEFESVSSYPLDRELTDTHLVKECHALTDIKDWLERAYLHNLRCDFWHCAANPDLYNLYEHCLNTSTSSTPVDLSTAKCLDHIS